MTELVPLFAATMTGAGVGVVFFGGLWLTVRHLERARQPALLILGSLLLRLLLACCAFYLLARFGDLLHLALAVAGVLLVRLLLTRRIASAATAGTASVVLAENDVTGAKEESVIGPRHGATDR